MDRYLHCGIRSFVGACLFAVTSIIVYIVLVGQPGRKFEAKKLADCSKLCPYVGKLTHDRLEFGFAHVVRNYPNFVCQPNFRNLADWIYGWPKQIKEHIEITTLDGREIAPCLPHGSIIYVSVWYIHNFFIKIYPHLINNFILITGEGDAASPSDIDILERSDSKIIHWFGQNGQIEASRSKKFTHIPIGKLYVVADFP